MAAWPSVECTSDAGLGRYLSPEPLLQWPAYVGTMAEFGSVLPTYAYAGNNPIRNTDPTGLETKNPYGGGCHRGFDDHCAAPEGCTPQRITVKGSENPGHAMTVPRAYAYCRQKGARWTKFVIYERDTAGTTGDWLVDCYTCVIRNVCAPSMPPLAGPSSGAP